MIKALFAQPQGDLDSAHIAGIGQNLGHGQFAERFVIMDAMAGNLDGAHLAVHYFFRTG